MKDFIGWVVAALCAVGGIVAGLSLSSGQEYYRDKLRVAEAVAETGPCGEKQLVVVDEGRVSVAGRLFSPDQAAQLKFRERANERGQLVEEVLYANGQILMTREAKRR